MKQWKIRNALRAIIVLLVVGMLLVGILVDADKACQYLNRAGAAQAGLSYPQLSRRLQDLASSYPGLISLSVQGQSVEGRNIWAVTVGKGPKKVVVTGTLHASEWIVSPVLLETIEAYAKEYSQGTEVKGKSLKSIFDTYSITFFPMVNPDGITLVQEGPDAFPHRKEELLAMNGDYGSDFGKWKANIRGVDLNRNFNVRWGEPTSQPVRKFPNYIYYGGPSPESEPETKAVANWVRKNNPEMLLDYHSYGEIINWYYLQKGLILERDRKIVQAMRSYSGYRMEAVRTGLLPSPTIRGWGTMVQKIPSFCVELGNKPPRLLTMSDVPGIFRKVKYLPLIAIINYQDAPSPVSMQSVSLPESLEIPLADTDSLKPVFSPANATNKAVSWVSSDPKVVSVDSRGQITALAQGCVTITVKTNDGGHFASCMVTVIPNPFLEAIENSKANWDSCDSVILVPVNSPKDDADLLANELKAPVLLTDGENFTSVTREEIKRLGPKRVFVCAAEDAIAVEVEQELKSVPGLQTVRFLGFNSSPQIIPAENAVVICGFSMPEMLSLAAETTPRGFSLVQARERDLYSEAFHILSKINANEKVLISNTDNFDVNCFPGVVRIDCPGYSRDSEKARQIFIAGNYGGDENGILLTAP